MIINFNAQVGSKTEWQLEDFLPAKVIGNQEVLIHSKGSSALLLVPWDETADEMLMDLVRGMGFSDVTETGSIDPYQVEGATTDVRDVDYFLIISPIDVIK